MQIFHHAKGLFSPAIVLLAVGREAEDGADAGANLFIFVEHDPLPLGPRHFAVLVHIVLEEGLLRLLSG